MGRGGTRPRLRPTYGSEGETQPRLRPTYGSEGQTQPCLRPAYGSVLKINSCQSFTTCINVSLVISLHLMLTSLILHGCCGSEVAEAPRVSGGVIWRAVQWGGMCCGFLFISLLHSISVACVFAGWLMQWSPALRSTGEGQGRSSVCQPLALRQASGCLQ